jgi:uncharacterized protein (TIGR02271 family)
MPNNTSAQEIAAFFVNESDAASAIRELKDARFRSDQIGSSIEDYDDDPSQSEEHRGFWSNMSDFFSGETGYEEHNTGSSDGPRLEGPAVGRTLTIPDHYREHVEQGGAFVSVYGDRAAEAENILMSNNGEIIRDFDRFESAGFDYENQEQYADQGRENVAQDFADEGHRIQLISEVLRVRKDRVQRGEVRLRKEVVTETQNIEVPVSREEIVVERVPVEGRPASGDIGSEKEIRVPLSEERITVEKKPIVKEEVRVGKRAVEDTKTVSDKARREELRVEKEGEVTELDEEDVDRPKRRKAA